jgi:hypothetical protein
MGAGPFLGVNRPGHILVQPPPSSAENEERVELYLYLPPAFKACSRVNLTLFFNVLLVVGKNGFCVDDRSIFVLP